MSDLITADVAQKLLDGATTGKRVQFHGSYCPEAVGTPFTDWDTSHEMSVIRPDGSRYRLASYKHAMDAYLSQIAPDLARTVIALHAELALARADTEAAVALALEEAVDAVPQDPPYAASGELMERGRVIGYKDAAYDARSAIRALAPGDAIAEVARLRAERDEWKRLAIAGELTARHLTIVQTELAAANAREAGLREALADLMTWFPDKPSDPEWRIKGGEWGADDAVSAARAALAQPNTGGSDAS